MLSNQIEFEYKGDIEEFEVKYCFRDVVIETSEVVINLDYEHFEELRQKLNKLYDELN